MTETPARIVGTLADAEGRQVTVGVSGGKVTLRTLGTRTGGAVELDGVMCEEFAQDFLSAVWQAAQQLATREPMAVVGHG